MSLKILYKIITKADKTHQQKRRCYGQKQNFGKNQLKIAYN